MTRILKYLCYAVCCFCFPAYAGFFNGSPSPGVFIGGVQIGAAGSSGIYSGYTLAAGDDFNSSLDLVHISSPLGRYFPVIQYENGTRGTTSLLGKSYDSDPYNTGHQDSNHGVALGSNTISQSGGDLTLLARLQNATETGNIGSGRTLPDGIIHTQGYLTVSTPAIIEAYIKFSSSPVASGWHPTFWVTGSQPSNDSTSGNESSGEEFDYEANTYNGDAPTAFSFNYNQHPGGPGGFASGGYNGLDNTWHLVSMVMTAGGNALFVDGSQVGSSPVDTTAAHNPFNILFSSHIINPTTISDWNSTLASPEQYQVDWYRVWLPNAQYPNKVISPQQNLPAQQVAFNTSMTYVFTSAASLWGAGISDYCQALPFEDYEPGCTTSFACGYKQFPAGLSYNSGTRTLTGVTSDQEPGRIHTACMPAYQSGGAVGYTARGYIDVGPTISPTTISYSNGAASFNVYSMGVAGDLIPKTMTVTGLPSGLTFNSSTFVISGTATTGGYTITVGVTNSSGQTASQSVTLTVGA